LKSSVYIVGLAKSLLWQQFSENGMRQAVTPCNPFAGRG
jgi:hypothetical protein